MREKYGVNWVMGQNGGSYSSQGSNLYFVVEK